MRFKVFRDRCLKGLGFRDFRVLGLGFGVETLINLEDSDLEPAVKDLGFKLKVLFLLEFGVSSCRRFWRCETSLGQVPTAAYGPS